MPCNIYGRCMRHYDVFVAAGGGSPRLCRAFAAIFFWTGENHHD